MTKQQIIEQLVGMGADEDDLARYKRMNKAALENELENAIAAANPDEDEEQVRKPMWQLIEARKRYVKLARQRGGKSICNGDAINEVVIELTPTQCAVLADALLGLAPATKKRPEESHLERYAHLNQGQIRMNSINKVRHAVLKAGTVTMEELKQAAQAV